MAPEEPQLGRSLGRELPGGGIRTFPQLSDFVEHLRVLGEVVDEEDLFDRRHDLFASIFHTWVQRGQAGCQFAVHLAKNSSDAGWLEMVVPDVDGDEGAAAIGELLAGAGSAESVEAVLILLPSVRSLGALAALCGRLCRQPEWHWIGIDGTDEGHALIGLRWHPPGSSDASWVLAFGPFEELPFTRRSPVTALTIRTRGPANSEGGLDLAKMDSLVDEERGRLFLDRTKKNKSDLLGGELAHAARARVTVRLPDELVPLLGPAGQSGYITDSGQPDR